MQLTAEEWRVLAGYHDDRGTSALREILGTTAATDREQRVTFASQAVVHYRRAVECDKEAARMANMAGDDDA